MEREYRTDIDAIKGIAIVAVIFYHIGMFPNGFLGVDAFLVINGFLIIPPLIRKLSNDEFQFIPWFTRRVFRLWPIVIAASMVSLVAGYWMMIPDSYENLAESVVASNLFANNILSVITTNYWDVATEYKPLMQMWYLGVVIQFYVLISLILYVAKKCFTKNYRQDEFWIWVIAVVGLVSLGLYMFGRETFDHKFYLVQYRIWEFAIGGIVGLSLTKFKITNRRTITYLAYIALCLIFVWNLKPISMVDNMTIVGMDTVASTSVVKMLLTIATGLVTAIILLTNVKMGGVFCWLGKMSLSLFVWHQVILAFIRYGFIEKFNWIELSIYIVGIIILSYISYKTIETIKLKSKLSKIIFISLLTIITVYAFLIYRNAGVVRDVPELGIYKENPYANRNTEYIDRIYKFEKPFETEKLHVLIMGNSFARDFASIVREYDTAQQLELSYAYNIGKADSTTIAKADYVFIFGPKSKVPKRVFENVSAGCKIYGIGTKSYGKNFGIFYAKRNSSDYFNQTVPSNQICDSINNAWSAEWGKECFIDIMEASRIDNGNIRIFTPDNKVISFDCRHLTPDGCKFYAKNLGLDTIFQIERK